jgi:two-component system, sensor histidine kinase PdtaS
MVMANNNSASKKLSKLRKRAEKALSKQPPENLESAELSNKEMLRLIHELQVHQIELEMQNDELRRFQHEIGESHNKYAELYEKYSNLYDFAPVGYFTIKEKGIIEQANLTGANLLCIDRQSLIGKPLARFISGKDQDIFYLHHLKVLKNNDNHSCEIKMMNYNNAPFYAQLESMAVRGADETHVKMRTAITDITNRKMADQQLQASLKEKEVLLQEVHHRVKNNMQIMISLINLQCEKIEDKHICEMFTNTVDRINSMALVHKQLYKSKNFSKIDITKYISSLVENLFASHCVDTDKISFKIGINDITLSLSNAISCGLIINELITNSLKYAFPGDRKGEIRVEFGYLSDGQLEMRVSDDGVGMPVNFELRNSETLGVLIVKALAEHQLGGTMVLDSTKGTKFLIRFK